MGWEPAGSRPAAACEPKEESKGPVWDRSSNMQQQHGTMSGTTSTASKAQLFEDTSSEIADIDNRLHALQSFLKAARREEDGAAAL